MSAFVAPVSVAARRDARSSPRRICSARASRDDELIDDASSEVYLRNMLQQNDGATGPRPNPGPNAADARTPPPPPPRARVPPPPPRPPPPRPPRESREPPPLDVPRPQKQYYSPERMERWDANGVPSAPNGLADGPPDLLQELLPLLAKEEQRNARTLTDKELELKDRVDACWNLYASTYKNSERLDNLRPFRLKDEAERVCERCAGEGMAQCEYCHGEGFVDLGENAEKFEEEFKGNTFTLPKLVMGNIYHCPLCGGLKEERCIECFGSGVIRDSAERQEGEAAEDVGDAGWHALDFDELLRKEADRIEIGLDGTIVMRAKKHKRTGRRGRKAKEDMAEEVLAELKDKEDKAEELLAELKEKETAQEIIAELKEKEKAKTETEEGTMKRKRGRPKKAAVGMSRNSNVRESGPAPTKQAFAQPIRRPPSSTDFLNTTDFKMGRKLSKQAKRQNQQIPDTPSSMDMKDNAGNKKTGKRKKKG